MIIETAELDRYIAGLRNGDARVLTDFWNQFGPLLQRLANNNLGAGMRRRLGPEDVAQSACRTFMRRAQIGEFHIDDSDGLWNLLCAITLTKLREKTRYHMRLKRAVQHEEDRNAGDGFDPAADTPNPASEAEFKDLLSTVLDGLDSEQREMLELRLQEHSQDEIAEKLGCSERTVRRILKKVQSQFENLLDTRV